MPLTEIADRVWVRSDLGSGTVTVVAGSRGTCLVDPPTDAGALLGLARDVEATTGTTPGLVTAWTGSAPGTGLAQVRAVLGPVRAHLHDSGREAPGEPDTGESDLGESDLGESDTGDVVWFSSVSVVDLGDRTVELLHLGRGPGAGATVAAVGGADVLAVGELVAAPGATPALGPGSHPLDWPLTLDLVLGLVGPGTAVVPGHGPPVTRSVVEDQRQDLGVLAETIRDLVERGVALDAALTDPAAVATWPYPAAELVHAVRRGYEQLPRSQRRLPLV